MRRSPVEGAPKRRILWIIGGGIVLLAAAVLLVLLVLRPAGAPSANAALLERVNERADPDTAEVLLNRRWGEGRFVLASYSRGDDDRLALGFAIEQRRGWRLTAYTDETVEKDDVVVGSLLVASSDGGPGQPAWSAAAGQLSKREIARVEIRWASGDETASTRMNDAYLVLQEGTTTPLEARYLTKDGAEVAKVPID